MFVFVDAELVVVYFIGTISSHYLKILIDRDLDEFWRRTGISMVVVIGMATVSVLDLPFQFASIQNLVFLQRF